MSLSVLLQHGSIQVGAAGDARAASAVYPLVGEYREEHAPEQDDALSGIAYERITIRTRIVAVAPSAAETQQTVSNVCADLTRRGQRVRLIEHGGSARDLAAQGGASGAVRGYPLVSVVQDKSKSRGSWLEFSVTIETLVPVPAGAVSGYNLVQHTWTMRKTRNADGTDTIRRSGSVRVRNDQSAETYITAIILDVAAAARPAGSRWEHDVTIGDDASIAEYEYTIGPPDGSSPGSSVTRAETTSSLSKSVEGRRVRTVSGFALGDGAAAYASGKRPTASATLVLTGEEIGEPREPDGRVDYRFTAITGVAGDTVGFPAGSVIFRYTESILPITGGRQVVYTRFAEIAPIRRMTELEEYAYEQVIEVEWRNATLAAIVGSTPCSMPATWSADDLVAQPRIGERVAGGVRSTTIRRVFASPTPLTVPAAREVLGL